MRTAYKFGKPIDPKPTHKVFLLEPSARQFVCDKVAHVLDGQLLAKILHDGLGFEFGQIGKGHPFSELKDSCLVDLAILHEIGIGENILGKQFAPFDFDVKRLFKSKDNIKKIDRLGIQISLEGRLRRLLRRRRLLVHRRVLRVLCQKFLLQMASCG